MFNPFTLDSAKFKIDFFKNNYKVGKIEKETASYCSSAGMVHFRDLSIQSKVRTLYQMLPVNKKGSFI